ncbi:MAG: hypothetical protein V1716_04645 [Candidatus Uhrbacteria bacterium]
MTNSFVFQDGRERLRTVISLNGVPLTKPGEYVYSIMIKQNKNEDFEEIATVPIKIDIDFKKNEK